MYNLIIFILACLIVSGGAVLNSFSNDSCPNLRTSINSVRKKRYIAFPDASTLVLTVSAVKAFMTHAPAGWNLVLEIDVIYPLPDAKFVSQHSRKKTHHHRQKRDFWNRLRDVLDAHNFNGEACVLRSICEAKYNLAPPGMSLVHDLLRAVLTCQQNIPTNEVRYCSSKRNEISDTQTKSSTLTGCNGVKGNRERAPTHEPSFIEELGGDYNSIQDPEFCNTLPDCPFSLLHFILDVNKHKY